MDTTKIKKDLIKESKEIEQYIIAMRRQVHMWPETGYEEEKTRALIISELRNMGYTDFKRIAKTGVLVTIVGTNDDGLTVALRADMDALNLTEDNPDKPYQSKIPGKMHACGHDTHIAMLLGAAKLIIKNKEHIHGTIKLIFQPAEEGGGGGKLIVEEGHLDDVDAIFGLHIWRDDKYGLGEIATGKGGILASADEIKITIKGKGGHAASPHESIDPTSVLVDIYNALQKLITREIDPLEPVVLTTPMLNASNAHNIIPEIAIITGTFRTYNEEIRDYILKRAREIAEGYCNAWRCECKFETLQIPYPPLINHDETVDDVAEILKELDTVNTNMIPSMGGEDFAFYTRKTKGVFLLLGTHNEEKGIIYPHHHPKFDVDEEILWKGTATYALLGLCYSTFKTNQK